MRIRASITIRRPAGEVFAYLADFGHDREWRDEVTEVRPLGGARGSLGERYFEAMHFPGVHVRSEFEVTAYEPPRLLEAQGLSEGMRASQRYEFTPQGEGAVLLDVSTHIETHGLLTMGEPVAAMLLNRRARENLRRLKRVLER